jgi:hypothetical protein
MRNYREIFPEGPLAIFPAPHKTAGLDFVVAATECENDADAFFNLYRFISGEDEDGNIVGYIIEDFFETFADAADVAIERVWETQRNRFEYIKKDYPGLKTEMIDRSFQIQTTEVNPLYYSKDKWAYSRTVFEYLLKEITALRRKADDFSFYYTRDGFWVAVEKEEEEKENDN